MGYDVKIEKKLCGINEPISAILPLVPETDEPPVL
jgi:hypothetical protein